jgi:hypothetical protein
VFGALNALNYGESYFIDASLVAILLCIILDYMAWISWAF